MALNLASIRPAERRLARTPAGDHPIPTDLSYVDGQGRDSGQYLYTAG